MATAPVPTQYLNNYNLTGLNLYTNILFNGYMDQVMQMDGQLVRSVNVRSYPAGAKMKRAGYVPFLNAIGAPSANLWSWSQDTTKEIFLYHYAGSQLYYYNQTIGTATSWLPCGNGQFGGKHIGQAVLDNVMIVGDDATPTRYTEDGINFTDAENAPQGGYLAQFNNSIFISGTSTLSVLSESTLGDATNWLPSPSIQGASTTYEIPGPGYITRLFVLANNLIICKSQGHMFRLDATFALWDMASDGGPTSPYSFAQKEGVGVWLNADGIMSSQGDTPQLLSNPIQPYIYNDNNTGISQSQLTTGQGVFHRYQYYLSIGSVQDDITNIPLNNAVLRYDYQLNEFLTYQFADFPTTYSSFKNSAGFPTLLFGNSNGQIFQFGGTATTDNGTPIATSMDLVFNFNAPYIQKDWRWLWAQFSPGCEARIQIAITDTVDRSVKNWVDIGQAKDGFVQYRFPPGARSRLLWVRITDESSTNRFIFYGITLGAVPKDPG